jgi:hypothetical protein
VVYEEARALLDVVAEDLRSAVVRTHSAAEESWVRFLADSGPEGKRRLRFTVAIGAEASHPILRQAGRLLLTRAPAAYDGRDDADEAAAGALAAPGGRMEVLYTLDPRPGFRRLWRGARAPVGGPDSLFIDANVESTAEDFALERVARPLADGVLHFDLRFWSPATEAWEPAGGGVRSGGAAGPTSYWDSTRALLEAPAEPGGFPWRPAPGSLDDPADDLFPELVEVTLVLAEKEGALGLRLVRDLSREGDTLELSAPLALPGEERDRFVLVDSEWIRVDGAGGGAVLRVPRGGRGARGTAAAPHERGSRVEAGAAFRRVVAMPGFRTGIEVREDARGRRTRP